MEQGPVRLQGVRQRPRRAAGPQPPLRAPLRRARRLRLQAPRREGVARRLCRRLHDAPPPAPAALCARADARPRYRRAHGHRARATRVGRRGAQLADPGAGRARGAAPLGRALPGRVGPRQAPVRMVAGNLRDQRAPRDAPLGLRTARRRRDRAAVHRPGRGLDARDHPRPPPQHRARPRRPGLLRAQAQFPRVHRAHRRRGRGQVAPVRAPAPGRPGARGQGGGPGHGQAGAQRQQRVVGARRPCRDRRHRGSRRHAGRQRLQGAERRQWRLDQLLQEVRARYRDQVPRARGAADQ
mmetsp:Transcript_5617/g.13391  ORF Transcript_5617/g.13391 Transcript_5617/m.13391 type:complete len:297 (+) Transcript_5617:520-1410(+)